MPVVRRETVGRSRTVRQLFDLRASSQTHPISKWTGIDQVVARLYDGQTRFSSLEIGCEEAVMRMLRLRI